MSGGGGKLNACFSKAQKEALQVYNIVQKQSLEMMSKICKPKPYVKIKSNVIVPPFVQPKISSDDEGHRGECECLETDDDPCGYSSDCINRALSVECNKSNCKTGSKCRNQMFQKNEYKPVELIFTGDRGW